MSTGCRLNNSTARPLPAQPPLPISGLSSSPIASTLEQGCLLTAGASALDLEEQVVFDATNAYRTSLGLAALRLSSTLQRAAAWKSMDMATRHYLAHDDGLRSWSERLMDCGYPVNQIMAENIAAGYAAGGAVFAGWRASPGHNRNLVNPEMRAIGLKRVQAVPADQYGWYWTMELGGIVDAPPVAPR